MKKILTTFIAIIIVISNILPVYAEEISQTSYPLYPIIESEAAVLMDARTGQVLFAKNMDEQLYPASITKIMTVLLGIENGNLNDIITMSREAVFSIERGSSHIALDVGEQITLEQALMAAILPSANEACNGIAEHVSGSIPEFIKLMNERANEAGALHTNFTNANGLYKDDHVTTAYDMAMITQTALKNDQFCRIFGTSKYEIPPTNMQSKPRYLWAQHKMFPCGRYEYEGVIGGKTGYTQESQRTLVTAAQRGDRELIAVVLKSQNIAVYTDTKALLDYGFNEFTQAQIMLPAVTRDNLANPPDNLQKLQKIINQIKAENYTRLLHKNIDVNDIVIDYVAVNNPDDENVQLNINMRLKDNSDLMYGNLGTISVDCPQNNENTILGKILNIVLIIMKIIAAAVIFLFALRWFIKIKRKMSRGRFSCHQIISNIFRRISQMIK